MESEISADNFPTETADQVVIIANQTTHDFSNQVGILAYQYSNWSLQRVAEGKWTMDHLFWPLYADNDSFYRVVKKIIPQMSSFLLSKSSASQISELSSRKQELSQYCKFLAINSKCWMHCVVAEAVA